MSSTRRAQPDRRARSAPPPSYDRRRAAPPPRGRRRISPGMIILAVALVGSVLYALYAVTVRDTSQIPALASGAVVLGIVFAALGLYALSATWRAGVDGRSGRALLLGVVGGMAAMAAAGCFAMAIIGFMLGNYRA